MRQGTLLLAYLINVNFAGLLTILKKSLLENGLTLPRPSPLWYINVVMQNLNNEEIVDMFIN